MSIKHCSGVVNEQQIVAGHRMVQIAAIASIKALHFGASWKLARSYSQTVAIRYMRLELLLSTCS